MFSAVFFFFENHVGVNVFYGRHTEQFLCFSVRFVLFTFLPPFSLPFHRRVYEKRINSNKNEFYGEMRNDKLWQMELKIYPRYAMSVCMSLNGKWSGFMAGICDAINVLHEPWTCTIISLVVFYNFYSPQHCEVKGGVGKPLFPCWCCLPNTTTFYNFFFPSFISFRFPKQIAQHRKKLFFNLLPLSQARLAVVP